MLKEVFVELEETSFEEKKEGQILAYAMLACKMLGYDVEKTSKTLAEDAFVVKTIFRMIDEDMIEFGSELV